MAIDEIGIEKMLDTAIEGSATVASLTSCGGRAGLQPSYLAGNGHCVPRSWFGGWPLLYLAA